jgi:succinate-acetate transporter protein
LANTQIPQANPAGLGLVCFGLTTVLLSLINAGILPPGGEPVVIPLAIAFGGTAQIIAGVFEVKLGNTFGMTAFIAYGAFWLWFGFLLLLGQNGVLNLTGAASTIGVALLLWGVFSLYMWIATFKLSRLLFFVFLTLWVTFFLLGFGALYAMPNLSHAGGWLGLVCGSLALYGSFAINLNSTFGRTVLPLG